MQEARYSCLMYRSVQNRDVFVGEIINRFAEIEVMHVYNLILCSRPTQRVIYLQGTMFRGC